MRRSTTLIALFAGMLAASPASACIMPPPAESRDGLVVASTRHYCLPANLSESVEIPTEWSYPSPPGTHSFLQSGTRMPMLPHYDSCGIWDGRVLASGDPAQRAVTLFFGNCCLDERSGDGTWTARYCAKVVQDPDHKDRLVRTPYSAEAADELYRALGKEFLAFYTKVRVVGTTTLDLAWPQPEQRRPTAR